MTIRDLDTDLFPIAGTALQITGADPVVVRRATDGTVEALGESLDEGDSYVVEAYVPEPTPEQMRAAVSGGAERCSMPRATPRLSRVPVPRLAVVEGPAAVAAPDADRDPRLAVRARAEARAPACAKASPPPTTSCARSRATSGPSTSTTSGRRRARVSRCAAFLFRDQIGYCQQFSGAMALMLRMLGIPARVAAGFTPGSYNARHQGVPRARPRRALVGRGLVHGRRLGSVRPDAVGRSGRLAVERRRRVRVRRLGRPPARRGRPRPVRHVAAR